MWLYQSSNISNAYFFSFNSEVEKSKIIMPYLFPTANPHLPWILVYSPYSQPNISIQISKHKFATITISDFPEIPLDLMIRLFRWQQFVYINRKHKSTYKLSKLQWNQFHTWKPNEPGFQIFNHGYQFFTEAMSLCNRKVPILSPKTIQMRTSV